MTRQGGVISGVPTLIEHRAVLAFVKTAAFGGGLRPVLTKAALGAGG